MPLDTHAAFRELENSGFDAKQAEALVHVINGATGEHATKANVNEVRDDVKADIKDVRDDFKELRGEFRELRGEFKQFQEEIRADFKEFREEVNAALKEQRDYFEAALKEQREDFKTALKEQREDFKAALKEQREDFKQEFATKADLRAEVATATNRSVLGSLAVAALLFAALQLFS